MTNFSSSLSKSKKAKKAKITKKTIENTANQNGYESNFGSAYVSRLPELGNAISDVLVSFGVKRIFGVGGDFAANLIQALSRHIPVLPSSNEMHAGFSSCGQAELSGMGVCLTTYTVGSLPCVSAAALAKTEKLPVIFISGAPGEQELGNRTIHHTVAPVSEWQPNYDCALDSFRSLGIRAERLQGARHPGQPNMAAERFYQLVWHAFINKEPVFIEVPRDLVFQSTQGINIPDPYEKLANTSLLLEGPELISQQIIGKLRSSKFPLVYVGENVKLNSKLKNQIMTFCHRHQIPYATSWLAKGVFDEFDPLSLGAYNGVFSAEWQREYIEKYVDYILEIDTSIVPQDTASAFHTGTHKVMNFENKTMIKGTVQNAAGLIAILDHLLACSFIPNFRMTERVLTLKEKAEKNQPKLESLDKIDFHNLADALNHIQKQIPQSLIYLPEVGNSFFASFGLKVKMSKIGRGWLSNPWYAAMGTAIPYGRALCNEIKDNEIKSNQFQCDKIESDGTPIHQDRAVLITGDGGFNFQHNELVHFLREDLSLIIIYLRNNIFHLGKSGDATIYQANAQDLKLDHLVRAYGGSYHQAKTVKDFNQKMIEGIENNKGIHFIEIQATPEEQYQCKELALLNLYIQKQNGNEDALKAWQKAISE